MEYLDGLLKVGSQVPSCGCRCHSLASHAVLILNCEASDPAALQAAGLNVAECAQLLCDTFAEMIFVHGRAHADPHAGNIYFKVQRRHVSLRCVYIYLHHTVH